MATIGYDIKISEKLEFRHRLIYTLLFIAVTFLAVKSAIFGAHFNFLNDSNSFKASVHSFSPSYAAHRIGKEAIGVNRYITSVSRHDLTKLSGDLIYVVINKPVDNALRIKWNGKIITSEGDMIAGRSMLKNSFVYGVIDKTTVHGENAIEIESFALYKSGTESEHVFILDEQSGIRVIKLLDFFNNRAVIMGLGCLLFSAMFAIYVYFVSSNKDPVWLYSSFATLSLCVYFLDYLKISHLTFDYFTYKKLFLLGLASGIWFYYLAMRNIVESKLMKALVGTFFLSYIGIMIYAKDLITFKTLYEPWYMFLIFLIFAMIVVVARNIKKNIHAYIYLLSFSTLGVYTYYAVTYEFKGGYFVLNSPMIYIMILALTPMINAFESFSEKERSIQLERQLKEEAFMDAMKDRLTGVWNKRYLDFMMFGEKEEIWMSLIDIDDFKKINDSYGHLAGDHVLRSIASVMEKATKETDEVIRYGGDEFLIVSSHRNQDSLTKLAEKIRSSVENLEIEYDDTSIKVTLSIGVGKIKGNKWCHEAFGSVDRAMYNAKKSGKNTIVSTCPIRN